MTFGTQLYNKHWNTARYDNVNLYWSEDSEHNTKIGEEKEKKDKKEKKEKKKHEKEKEEKQKEEKEKKKGKKQPILKLQSINLVLKDSGQKSNFCQPYEMGSKLTWKRKKKKILKNQIEAKKSLSICGVFKR